MFVFIFGFHLAPSSPLALSRLLAVLFCLVVFAHCFDYFERVFRLSLFIIPLFFSLVIFILVLFFFCTADAGSCGRVWGAGGEAKRKNRYLDMSDTEKKGTHTHN